MIIGKKIFDTEKETYVMGILNITPDSFSDGGKYNDMDAAMAHCEEMIAQGADIIDVGGESTKPGFVPVPAEEQIARIVPVIEEIKKRFDVPVSVDTYDASVAEAAINAGADLINDIYGLKKDPKMAEVIAEHKVPCVLMHNRVDGGTEYNDFIADVMAELQESIELALSAGIAKENIILDPGVGFAKNVEQNLQVIADFRRFNELGYPLLLGTSRKSVIGLTLNIPIEERLAGTLATTVIGVMKGCSFVRVHDVKENVEAIQMTKAILK